VPGHLTSLNVAVAPYLASSQFYFSPLKVFEYMACGRAIVASSIGQLASIIDHGHNGMLYPPGDMNGLFETLLNLAERPELVETLGYAARETAIQSHSWQQVVETVLNFVRADCLNNMVGRSLLTTGVEQ
jgi:glycosyltransferase involved in cell wall biosynthesis